MQPTHSVTDFGALNIIMDRNINLSKILVHLNYIDNLNFGDFMDDISYIKD